MPSGMSSSKLVTKSSSVDACFFEPDYQTPDVTQDGVVETDEAWWSSFRHIFNQQIGMESAAMQVRRQDGFAYLSFEVEKDEDPDDNDFILIGLEPSSDPTDARLMRIFPMPKAPQSGDKKKVDISKSSNLRFWKGSGWESGTNQTDVNWTSAGLPSAVQNDMEVHYSVGGSSPNYNWEVEIKLPIAALNLPTSGTFGLYVNTVVLGPGTVKGQFAWPAGSKLTYPTQSGPGSNPEFVRVPGDVPALDEWGTGRTDPNSPCGGVYFDSDDLYVNGNASNRINPNSPNTFYLDLYNRGSQTANSVGADFSSKDRSVGYDYTFVAEEKNTVDVPPNSQMQGPKLLKSKDVAASQFGGNSTLIGCMRAEVDSRSTNTTFAVQGVRNNIGIQRTNSPYADTTLVTLGETPVPEGMDAHEVLLSTYGLGTGPDATWEEEVRGAERTETGYRVTVPQDEPARLLWEVTPPEVDIPSETMLLEPGSDGAVTIPVDPGDILTLIIEGQIQRGDATVTPLGRSMQEVEPIRTEERGELLAPVQRYGAVVVSWDEFDSHVAVPGTRATLKAPEEADELTLAINDTPEGYEQYEEGGFRVQVVRTATEEAFADKSPLAVRSFSLETPTTSQNRIPFGTNMPTHVICARRNTGQVLRVKGEEFPIYESIGCTSTVLRQIR